MKLDHNGRLGYTKCVQNPYREIKFRYCVVPVLPYYTLRTVEIGLCSRCFPPVVHVTIFVKYPTLHDRKKFNPDDVTTGPDSIIDNFISKSVLPDHQTRE